MYRDHDRINVNELEKDVNEMLHKVLSRLDHEIISVKEHAGDGKKKLLEESELRCASGNDKILVHDTLRNFYQEIINDLTQVQALCQEYRISGLLDMARETEMRLKPEKYKRDLKKSFNRWRSVEKSNEEDNTYKTCPCRWENVPESELEPTQDILKRVMIPRRTEFDSSDLKFKQELSVLRRKMFTLPESIPERRKIGGFNRASSLLAELKAAGGKIEFTSAIEESVFRIFSNIDDDEEFNNESLKFVDGQFANCELWKKLLDSCGNQLRSKWLLVLCPQMEVMLKRHAVPLAYFKIEEVFALLSRIEENGASYILSKDEMLFMLVPGSEAAECLVEGWRIQFKFISGIQLAATTIQRYWRGYAVRRDIRESDCKYIAASIIWMAWLFVKKRRYMHAEYLTKMLTMMRDTDQLNEKISTDYHQFIKAPHFVIHLPSLGHPFDIRSSISPAIFRIYQNILALKLSFLRNPNAELIYILPVEPSENLLQMYYDILESVHPDEGIQKRVTFLALSMRNAFTKCSFNTARTLYYSDETVAAIRAKIVDKQTYILPWVMDECDVWVAGALRVPWVGPSLTLQSKLLNKSHNAELLTSFGIHQPEYIPYVKDYQTLCAKLAELISLHTEICLWLIKLNIGIDGYQTGVFLINNVSVPFMPELRRARKSYGEAWKTKLELRKPYLDRLLEHLPSVVFNATRLGANYKNWKEFSVSLSKHGCFIQAVPNEKNFSIISAAVFIPCRDTGMKPEWVGTADQLHLETQFTAFGFMMPQTSFPNENLRSSVTRLAEALQRIGYFGYASFDLFCYVRRADDSPVVLVLDVDPYYSKVHNFLNWFLFTINGSYNPEKNIFESDVKVSHEFRKNYHHSANKTVQSDETIERFGIAMGRLHHTQLYRHRWPKLYYLGKKCKITYDPKTRIGSHVLFHDGESRAHVMMSSSNVTMKQCLQTVTMNLKNLSKALTIRYKGVVETNIAAAATYLATITAIYQPLNRESYCNRAK